MIHSLAFEGVFFILYVPLNCYLRYFFTTSETPAFSIIMQFNDLAVFYLRNSHYVYYIKEGLKSYYIILWAIL
jgi:hypothetical protein